MYATPFGTNTIMSHVCLKYIAVSVHQMKKMDECLHLLVAVEVIVLIEVAVVFIVVVTVVFIVIVKVLVLDVILIIVAEAVLVYSGLIVRTSRIVGLIPSTPPSVFSGYFGFLPSSKTW